MSPSAAEARELMTAANGDRPRPLAAGRAIANVAQRRMIADSRYQAPYHWASYQVTGDGLVGIPTARP